MSVIEDRLPEKNERLDGKQTLFHALDTPTEDVIDLCMYRLRNGGAGVVAFTERMALKKKHTIEPLIVKVLKNQCY